MTHELFLLSVADNAGSKKGRTASKRQIFLLKTVRGCVAVNRNPGKIVSAGDQKKRR
ncbi:hypothetical protein CSB69_1821 [Morganella morganii]|nr:hypothetical protein CSB69_1821 [Morganella morganii]